MVAAKAGYYRPSSANTLVLTKAGDQIPSSWGYIGPTNPTNWPVTVFANPVTAAPPAISNSVTSSPGSSGTTAVVPKVADGSVFVTNNGTYVQTANTGFGVPSSWTALPAGTAAPDGVAVVNDPLVGTAIVSTGDSRTSSGQVYITSNGAYLSVPAGQQVPAGWVDTTAANIDTTGQVIIQAPDGNAVAQNAYIIQVISGILALGGVGLLGYLGYQVISNPESVISTLKRMNMFKDLLGDAAQIAGFMVILAGIGFATYEFASTYIANDFDIAKTLGDLVSSLILTVLESVGDAIVDLFSKIGSAIAGAIF